jgi:hypothetical protein
MGEAFEWLAAGALAVAAWCAISWAAVALAEWVGPL